MLLKIDEVKIKCFSFYEIEDSGLWWNLYTNNLLKRKPSPSIIYSQIFICILIITSPNPQNLLSQICTSQHIENTQSLNPYQNSSSQKHNPSLPQNEKKKQPPQTPSNSAKARQLLSLTSNQAKNNPHPISTPIQNSPNLAGPFFI